jgi:hypothetical protein
VASHEPEDTSLCQVDRRKIARANSANAHEAEVSRKAAAERQKSGPKSGSNTTSRVARVRIDNAQGIGATDSRPPTHGYPADLPTEKRSNKDPCNRPLKNSYSIGRHAYNKPKAKG